MKDVKLSIVVDMYAQVNCGKEGFNLLGGIAWHVRCQVGHKGMD